MIMRKVMMTRLSISAATLALVGASFGVGAGFGAAQAQVAPITGVDNFTLPTGQPTPTPTPTLPSVPTSGPPAAPTVPLVETPAPTPTPSASSTPTPKATTKATTRAAPRAAPAASVRQSVPTPAPVATPTPAPVPATETTPGAPAPAPTPVASPSSVATAANLSLPPAEEPARPFWLLPTLLLGLVLAAAAVFARRRRRPEEPVEDAAAFAPVASDPVRAAPIVPAPIVPAPVVREPVVPAPVAPPVETPQPVAAAPAPRFLEPAPVALARIDIDEPVISRAGVNMVTATADVAVIVRNTSDVPAIGIALEVRLLSAQAGQDAVIAALFSGPVERPVTPLFDLAPGETKRVRTLATMPRDAITVLQAGDRPMFVPVVAIRAVYAGAQTTSVHAIGIERPGQAKLGPFWLDQPSRMYDAIGVRPHTGR